MNLSPHTAALPAHANRFMLRILLTGVLCCTLLTLAACGDKIPKRDFNELIPRLMGSMKPAATPTEAAANLFNVTSPDERRDAIAFLETQKYGHDPAYMRAYEVLTTDPSPMVRAQAMRALGSSGDPSVVPYLLDGTTGNTGMADLEPEVRRDACQSLLKIFTLPAIPVVVSHLGNDPDDQVRICCARALRNTGDPAAYRALILALNDKNPAVVYWAHETLIAGTKNSFDFDPKPWLSWYHETYEKPTTPPPPQS